VNKYPKSGGGATILGRPGGIEQVSYVSSREGEVGGRKDRIRQGGWLVKTAVNTGGTD